MSIRYRPWRPFKTHRTLLRIGRYQLSTTSDPFDFVSFKRHGDYAHIYGVWSYVYRGLVLRKNGVKCECTTSMKCLHN